MKRMKYKYVVEMAYVDNDNDSIKIEYVETLSYSAHDAQREAIDYIERFTYVGQVTVITVTRQ